MGGDMESISTASNDGCTDCSICLDEQLSSDMCSLLHCQCLFCLECVRQHFTLHIREGNIDIGCPVCSKPVTKDQLSGIVSGGMIRRYDRLCAMKEENSRVSSDPKLTWCPTPDCHTVVKREREGLPKGTGCAVKCSKCCKEFCFECLQPPHEEKSCVEALKKRSSKSKEKAKSNERKFLQWAAKKTKSCPDCKALIERARDDGPDCNHMICGSCKTEFCWLCGVKVPPLGHFDITNMFGCPGLQYSGPDVSLKDRMIARGRAASVRAGQAAKKGARYGGIGLGIVVALPFAVAAAAPAGIYMYVKKHRRRQQQAERQANIQASNAASRRRSLQAMIAELQNLEESSSAQVELS